MTVYVDTNVYIEAWRSKDLVLAQKAFDLITDPNRRIVSSQFVRLELLPKAQFHGQSAEVLFYESLLAFVSVWVSADDSLILRAIEIGTDTDTMGVDAIHLAAAERGKADQFVTCEALGRPIYHPTHAVAAVHLGSI